MEDVAVLGEVFLALDAHLAGVLGALFALAGDEVLVGDGLGADEAALEVSVDDPGGLRRAGAAADGPGTGLLAFLCRRPFLFRHRQRRQRSAQ